MRDSDYTTLAFLAQAVVSEPDKANDFVEAVKEDRLEESTPDLQDSEDLFRALRAFEGQWQAVRARNDSVTREDVVEIARQLEMDPDAASKVAAIALVIALREYLTRKRREGELSDSEREVAERLAEVTEAATL